MLTIGELALQFGCSIDAIRYYERTGLLSAAQRTAGGHRTYTERHCRELNVILRAREIGFSSERIRDLLRLVLAPRPSCAEVHEIALAHLYEVRARLAELTELEATLSELTADHPPQEDCPLVAALLRSY